MSKTNPHSGQFIPPQPRDPDGTGAFHTTGVQDYDPRRALDAESALVGSDGSALSTQHFLDIVTGKHAGQM